MKTGVIALIVTKMSGLDFFIHKNNIESYGEAYLELQRRGLDVDRIRDSHHRQKTNLDVLVGAFRSAGIDTEIVPRSQLNRTMARYANYVIAFGGDNHFIYVSHYVDVPILPINSDPETSVGYLLQTPDYAVVPDKLLKQEFDILEWPKLFAYFPDDGQTILATQELFIGEADPWDASHCIIRLRRGQEVITHHRGSGTIIANGVGVTGWYAAAGGHNGYGILPTSHDFVVFCRERMNKPGSTTQHDDMVFSQGDSVRIQSNNENGIIIADSLPDFKYPFRAGATVDISVSFQLRATRIISLRS